MKIVHTGDWHIGKTLRGRHRSQEYREILDELKTFIEKEDVDILLIAGDVYDSFSPSAESENIVYSFFHDVSKLGVKTVVVAGNHDSGLRFEAVSNLLALANVTVVGFFDHKNPLKSNVTLSSRDGKEKAYVALLPFVFERTFTRAEDLVDKESSEATQHYSQQVGQILNEFSHSLPTDTINILLSHLLMHGARPGGGERRLYLGDNYAVHPEHIPANFDYIALGHVHRYQKIDAPSPIYYCGSPLQMDFGEKCTEKGFLFLSLQPGEKKEPSFIPFTKGKELNEVQGSMEEIQSFIETHQDIDNQYFKVTIRADASSLGLSYKIKKQLPNAVEIRREYVGQEKKDLLPQGSDWLPELYQKYCEQTSDKPLAKEILEEFHNLYKECGFKDSEKNKLCLE